MSIVNLPSGYRQAEYIQSSGTQFVDSGVIPTTNTKVEADIDFLSGNTTYNCVFGVGQTGSNQFVVYRLSASAMVGQVYSTKTYNSSGVTITGRHKVSLSNSQFVYGTFSTAVTAESFTYTYPIFLFALNSVGSATLHAHQKLYSCKIYNGNTLIRNFIPCINPSGVVGLYDIVNAKFYGNSGTGVFTAGPYLAVDTPANFEQILAVYLRWGAVDCEAYKIFRNGSLIGTTTDTHYIDLNAEQNETYIYTLIAYRGASPSRRRR